MFKQPGMIAKIKLAFSAQFSGLPLHDVAYKSGAFILGAYLILGAVFGLLFGFESGFIQKLANIFVYFIATIFTVAVFIEYWHVLKPLFNKTWVKWIGAILAYLIFRYSEGKAEDFINEFTGVDPSSLPNASSLLAALFLPYSWGVFVAALLGLYIVVIWFFIPVQINKDEKNIGGWKVIARIVGLITIYIILEQLISAFDEKGSLPALLAQETVLRTEYFQHSNCKGLPSSALVADLGGGNISVFIPQTVEFMVMRCEYDIPPQ